MENIHKVIDDYLDKFWPNINSPEYWRNRIDVWPELDINIFHQMMNKLAEENDITNMRILAEIFMKSVGRLKHDFEGYKIINYCELSLMIMKILVEEYNFDIYYDYGLILGWAYHNNNFLAIKYLLERGIDPNFCSNAISSLIVHKNMDAIKLCVEYGLDLKDVYLLGKAVDFNSTEVVPYLLDLGVEPTPELFCRAVNNGCLSIVEIFIEYGIDVNCNNSQAILLALYQKNTLMIELLLKNGAKIIKINLKESSKTRICDILRKYDIDESTILKLLIMDKSDTFVNE